MSGLLWFLFTEHVVCVCILFTDALEFCKGTCKAGLSNKNNLMSKLIRLISYDADYVN